MQFPGAMSFIKRYQEKAPGAGVDPLGYYIAPWGYADLQVLGDAMQNVQRQQGWTPADEKASAARTAPVWHCTFDTLDGAWVIESVATIPEFRRRGLVDALMAEILEAGRTRGHRLAQLTILIGNVAAQRAYEKAGFRVRDEKRHRDFQALLGAPGFMRMVRSY